MKLAKSIKLYPTPKTTQVDPGFYRSAEWRKFRKFYLMEHPVCVHCEAKGLVREASVVDHIVPIREGGNRFAHSNLQPLCDSCHNSKRHGERE